MSEKEKQHANNILEALNKLTDAKGPEYTKGLIDGINIGTAQAAGAEKQPG